MGPGKYSRLVVIHNWKAFFAATTKTNSLLQTWLICIILYVAHLLYFCVLSQDQQGLLTPSNSLLFLHLLYRQRRELYSLVRSLSWNYIFVNAFLGLLLLLASLSSVFTLSSHIAPAHTHILEYFLVLPKMEVACFFLYFLLLVFEAFQEERIMNLCYHIKTGSPEGFCRQKSVLIRSLHQWYSSN